MSHTLTTFHKEEPVLGSLLSRSQRSAALRHLLMAILCRAGLINAVNATLLSYKASLQWWQLLLAHRNQ